MVGHALLEVACYGGNIDISLILSIVALPSKSRLSPVQVFMKLATMLHCNSRIMILICSYLVDASGRVGRLAQIWDCDGIISGGPSVKGLDFLSLREVTTEVPGWTMDEFR